MPMFEKIINADGIETYAEVELSKLDVREHPEYKKVLDEQIKTRKKLQDLKKAAETPEDAPSSEVVVPPTPATVIPTIDDVLSELDKRTKAKQVEEANAMAILNSQVDAAMLKHKLPAAMRAVVANARDVEAQAEALAKSGLTFANSPSGSDDTNLDVDNLFKNIDKRMGFTSD